MTPSQRDKYKELILKICKLFDTPFEYDIEQALKEIEKIKKEKE